MSPLDVSLRQLEYIVAVADLKGFRRAADACDVAQPSLSMQVALAERQLGVQIFERDSRSVRLSVVGTAIVEQARRVLLAARELRDLARRSADPFHGTLRLGVIPTIGPYLLPEITPALARAFPHLQLLWTEARTAISSTSSGWLMACCSRSRPTSATSTARSSPATRSSSRRPRSTRSSRARSATPADVLNGQVVLILEEDLFPGQTPATIP